HRYVLPGFLDRMKERLNNHCDDDHHPWPARGRHACYLANELAANRSRACERDLLYLESSHVRQHQPAPRVAGVSVTDRDTSEIRGEF
ncbi:MAG TPA: hypothetical protein DEG43_06855, partial [Acidimicrobiaceae bacterium]|nr:hypothetical protein [Acidimicrobiaceae bacterium]